MKGFKTDDRDVKKENSLLQIISILHYHFLCLQMVELDLIPLSTSSVKVMLHFIWSNVAINSRKESESERWTNEAELNTNKP